MLTFFILGDILGAGIYASPARSRPTSGRHLASFLVSFLLALITAFAYLELVTKYLRGRRRGRPLRPPGVPHRHPQLHGQHRRDGLWVTSASFAATRVGGRYWTGVFGIENPPTVLIGILVILLCGRELPGRWRVDWASTSPSP